VNPLLKLFVKAHVWLYRSSKGRRGVTMRGRDVILLTTRGRRSGEPRTVALVPFIAGDERGEMFVIASLAGAPKHPAWFFNLQADPEVTVQLGQETWKARATEVGEDERAPLWERITAAMPDYAEYQAKTSRVIPIVRLVRAR
jgi:deazaflavin-dependent oxidoreductase (nitroreductase family)